MKLLCKISLITAAFLAFISISAAAYSDVSEEYKYRDSIEKVTALGIMSGYPDGNFYPEKSISRAEAASLFAGILNLSADFSANTFTDVAADYWAKGDIESAAAFGCVSGTGNGTFMPDGDLSKLQAAVMVLNTMGYKSAVQLNGGYPDGYRKFAADNGLFKRISGGEDETITRGEFAMMLSNALDMPLMVQKSYNTTEIDEDATLLTGILKLGKAEGRVTGNDKTMLTSQSALAENSVQVADEIYNIGGTRIDGEMGKYVKLYYREEYQDEKTVLYYELKAGYKELKISADRLEGFKNNRLDYADENGRLKHINISETADVIFNGRYKTACAEDFLPGCGDIDLYDSDNDGKFDVVNITSYVTYIVSAVNGDKIYDKYGQKILDLSDIKNKHISVESASGPILISDITEDDLLSIAADDVEYKDGYPYIKDTSEIYDIRLSRTVITGRITAVSEDYITIDNEEYKKSAAYSEAVRRGKISEFKAGEEGDFRIDFFGELAGRKDAEKLSADGNYAYAVYCYILEGEKGIGIKAYDFALNDFIDFECTEKVYIDGISYSASEKMYRAMRTQYNGTVTDEFVPRLIVYKRNTENAVNRIDTDYLSDRETKDGSLVYNDNQGSRMFGGNCFGGDIVVSSSTKILALPRIRASAGKTFDGNSKVFTADVSMKDYIYFRKPGAFTADSTTKYTTETYNIKDSGEAELIVYYYSPAKASSVISYLRNQTMMVEEVLRTDMDGEPGYEIRGICGEKIMTMFLRDDLSEVADVRMRDGETVSAALSADKLKCGDIVRYSDVRQNTNITLRLERIFNPDEENEYSCEYYSQADSTLSIEKDPYFRAFNVAYGGLKLAENDIIKLDFERDLYGNNGFSYNLSENTINVYDGNEITQYPARELMSYQNTQDINAAARLVIVTQNGAIKAAYAYNFN